MAEAYLHRHACMEVRSGNQLKKKRGLENIHRTLKSCERKIASQNLIKKEANKTDQRIGGRGANQDHICPECKELIMWNLQTKIIINLSNIYETINCSTIPAI